MPALHFGFQNTTFVLFLLVLAAAATAWLFYRYTLPPVSFSTRILLSLLRGTALSLMLLLLFQPLLRLVFTSTELPVLAVLVDNSESMTLNDGGRDRSAILSDVLHSEALERLSRSSQLRLFTFGSALRPLEWETRGSLPLDEKSTDISAALRSLERQDPQHHLNAVLLLSDGSYNVGQNPVHDAERLTLPLFSVGIGDSSTRKDVLLSRVSANDLVYSDVETPVTAAVKSSGYNGERVEVTLNEDTKVLDRTMVTLQETTGEYVVHFLYVPTGEGTRKYTIRVSPAPGELTTENNQRSFFVRILRSKLRVLILAGSPSPDLSAVRQILIEAPNLTVQSFSHKSPSEFYEGRWTRSQLDSADCLVLIGYPSRSTSDDQITILRDLFSNKKTPLLFLSGRALDQGRLPLLGAALPFAIDVPSSTEQQVYFQPSERERTHVLLTMGTPDRFEAWKKLPPVFKTLTVYRSKPDATVLGTTRVQTTISRDPFIIVGNSSRQKCLAILGYGIWRWRLMAQGNPETSSLLAQFLTGAIQWLTSPEETRPVRVTTSKAFVNRGEAVEFVGQVYDERNRPLDNARVRVNIRGGEEIRETDLLPIGNGRYEGMLEGLREGDYGFQTTAEAGGVILGEDSGKFSVGGFNLEFQDTRMNAPLLQELAFTTGGQFLSPAQFDSLEPALRRLATFAPRTTQRTESLEIWHWTYTLGLLLAVFAAEWFVRKRSGMM